MAIIPNYNQYLDSFGTGSKPVDPGVSALQSAQYHDYLQQAAHEAFMHSLYVYGALLLLGAIILFAGLLIYRRHLRNITAAVAAGYPERQS